MKNTAKMLSIIFAIALIISMTAVFASATVTGTGTQEDPYVLESGDITIAAGETAYVYVDATEVAVNFYVNTPRYWDYTVQVGVMPQGPNMLGNVAIEGLSDFAGNVAITNTGAAEAVFTVTIEALEVGTYMNPAPATWFDGASCYLMNTTLEAGDVDGYWYSFTADRDGIIYVETLSDIDYEVMVEHNWNQGLASEGNPIITYKVTAGDEIKVNVAANPDENWEYPAGSVYVSAFYAEGTEEDPIPVKSGDSFKIPVTGQSSLSFVDSSRDAAISSGTLIITAYEDVLNASVVTVNGVEYTPENGQILVPVGGSYYDRPVITITNNHEWNGSYYCTVANLEQGTGHVLQYFEGVEPNCYEDGMAEYYYCAECDVYYDAATMMNTNPKNLIIPRQHTFLVHVDAVAPACHYEGNVEYWVCYDCEGFWTDEACTELTNSHSVILPELGGEVVHVEAVEPTCWTEGNIEHWYCEECQQVWQDEAMTQLTNHMNVKLGALNHQNVIHFDAVEPACHYEGNIEYWYCPDCEGFWQDEALTQVTNSKNVVLPELGGELVHVEAVAPTCWTEGNIEHWYCEECGQVWQDEAMTQLTNHMNVKLGALNHQNVVHFDAVAPGCHMNGNMEYWYCPDCEGFWQDEALTQVTNSKNVVLPMTGEGNLVHMEAVAPGCHMNGNIEYWVCYECEQVWQDEALTQLTNIMNVVLPALGGEVVHVEAKAPTCDANGCIEHWYCETCEQVWQNENLTQLTNHLNVVLGATGHNYVDGKCTVCGTENPDTGDKSMISVAVAAALVSAMCIVALPVAKKHF